MSEPAHILESIKGLLDEHEPMDVVAAVRELLEQHAAMGMVLVVQRLKKAEDRIEVLEGRLTEAGAKYRELERAVQNGKE